MNVTPGLTRCPLYFIGLLVVVGIYVPAIYVFFTNGWGCRVKPGMTLTNGELAGLAGSLLVIFFLLLCTKFFFLQRRTTRQDEKLLFIHPKFFEKKRLHCGGRWIRT
jgi:hypothetical protein